MAGHRAAPRLEDVVGDDAGEHAAEDAGAAEQQAPVLVDEAVLQAERVVGLLGEGAVPLHDRLAQEAAAELDAGDGHDDRVAQHHLEDRDRRPGAGPSSPEEASAGVEVRRGPASPGVLRTTKKSMTQKTTSRSGRHEEDPAPGRRSLEDHARPSRRRSRCPSEIRMPKMAPKTPRSRTWNQGALTLTMATAPKLWKYMFTRVEHREDEHEVGGEELVARARGCSSDQVTSPMSRFATAAPAAPIRIEKRAAEAVGQRPVDQEGEAVDHGADAEDDAEVVVAHQRARRPAPASPRRRTWLTFRL